VLRASVGRALLTLAGDGPQDEELPLPPHRPDDPPSSSRGEQRRHAGAGTADGVRR
jgi:hypothetical protein